MSKTRRDQTEEKIESIGSLLKNGRDAKGLSIEDVVNRLNLSEEKLVALERDDFTALPDPVFIQGYLRSYAKILDIDAQPLIESYQEGLPKRRHDALIQSTIKEEVHSGHGAVKIVSWAIGIGFIVTVALWWSSQTKQELVIDELAPESVIEPPAVYLPEITEPEKEPAEELPLAEPVVIAPLTEEPIEEPPSVVEVEPVVPTESAVEEAAQEQEQEQAVVDEVEQERVVEVVNEPSVSDAEWDIVLSFSGPCWVTIRDADNRVRILGNMAAGERRTVEGPAPYRVVLGNSSAVELHINGKMIDLKPYSKDNVIRFTLDPAKLLKL